MRYVVAILLMLLVTYPLSAQTEEQCVVQTESPLEIAAQSCSATESGSMCLGYGRVESMVNCEDIPPFEQSGDMIPIQAICALRLQGQETNEGWGIVYMQIPTSVDTDLDMVLVGDLEIQNAASSLSQIRVWIQNEVSVHSGPGRPYEVLTILPAGQELYVNGCNCTRHWFRTQLEDGRIGWLSANDVTIIGETTALPVVDPTVPVYKAMQSFRFISAPGTESCSESPAGIFIQSPQGDAQIPIQINGVRMLTNATLFVQSRPGSTLSVTVLDGTLQAEVDGLSVLASTGMRVDVPLSDEGLPLNGTTVRPYTSTETASLPLDLLRNPVDPLNESDLISPRIVGHESCEIVSNRDGGVCPLYFVNPDGDAITQMDVQFVSAPQGKWTDQVTESPQIIAGDFTSGQVAWQPSCSLGAANFIGPVKWNVTLTDVAGHTSPAYEVSFNCVDG